MARRKVDETYQLNIYKLNRGISSLEDLMSDLDSEIESRNKADNERKAVVLDIQNLENISVMYLAYKNSVPKNEIDWYAKWQTFFGFEIELRRSSLSGHGLLIFHITETGEYYCATFGRSFSLIKKYIDQEYGLKMAGILFDGRAMDTISSKYFSMTANKALVSYHGEQPFSFKEGEAFDLMKASVVEHPGRPVESRYIFELKGLIQNPIQIGFSNIRVTARQKEIEFGTLASIAKLLSKIEANYEPRFNFPKMQIVKDKDKVGRLNKKLLESIVSGDSSIQMSIPFYNKDATDNFVFMNSISDIVLQFGRGSSGVRQSYEGFEFEDVVRFLKGETTGKLVDDIAKVRIIVNSGGEGEPSDLINWIDAHIDLPGDENPYAINNGQWVTFNDTYIETINKRIEALEKDLVVISPDLNISRSIINQYYLDNKIDILQIFNGSTGVAVDIPELYLEIKYNHMQAQDRNLYLFDRQHHLFDGIEVCDLYDPVQKSLIHVKSGKDNRQLEECLRQSFLAIKYFHRHKEDVCCKVNTKNQQIGEVKNIKVLYLLKKKQATTEFKLSNLTSLKHKTTLLSWVEAIQTMKYKPQIVIATLLEDLT